MNIVYLLYTILKVVPGACDVDSSIKYRLRYYGETIFSQ
jgi:hypothetical protein